MKKFIDENVAPYWKAVMGFVIPGVVVLSNAQLSKGHIDSGDWVLAIFACVLTSGGVYAVANKSVVAK